MCIWVPHVLEHQSVDAGCYEKFCYQNQDGGQERRTQYLSAVDFDSKLLHHDEIYCDAHVLFIYLASKDVFTFRCWVQVLGEK